MRGRRSSRSARRRVRSRRCRRCAAGGRSRGTSRPGRRSRVGRRRRRDHGEDRGVARLVDLGRRDHRHPLRLLQPALERRQPRVGAALVAAGVRQLLGELLLQLLGLLLLVLRQLSGRAWSSAFCACEVGGLDLGGGGVLSSALFCCSSDDRLDASRLGLRRERRRLAPERLGLVPERRRACRQRLGALLEPAAARRRAGRAAARAPPRFA